MIITRLIKYMVAVVGNTVKGIINNYKAKVEVLIEVHSKVIARKSTIFVKSQIANQLGTLLMSKREYIISFAKVQEILKIIRLL